MVVRQHVNRFPPALHDNTGSQAGPPEGTTLELPIVLGRIGEAKKELEGIDGSSFDDVDGIHLNNHGQHFNRDLPERVLQFPGGSPGLGGDRRHDDEAGEDNHKSRREEKMTVSAKDNRFHEV